MIVCERQLVFLKKALLKSILGQDIPVEVYFGLLLKNFLMRNTF